MELARAELPALDRLLQAITAADLDGIERVLDDELARHIEAVLTNRPAAAAFRGALLDALERAADGVVWLEHGAGLRGEGYADAAE